MLHCYYKAIIDFMVTQELSGNMDTKKENILMAPIQCRMARTGLRLGIRELATLADVSPNTIARFERGENLHRRTIKAMQNIMEEAGARFFVSEDGSCGVVIKEGE